jgi:uncharacterized protein YbgA (DUF1722 family)/uncharacterized protein YbbK (DUF523 family)
VVTARVRVGVSACLLGEQVRFDGGHKRDRFLTEILGPHVEWVPVCPEVEMGLGTPRETLRLVDDRGKTRLITTRTGEDHTDGMEAWAKRRLATLGQDNLDGYVLKSKSPSCGIERVKVYRAERGQAAGRRQAQPLPSTDDRRNDDGAFVRLGRGLFAAALVESLPVLPIEEEGRLMDPVLRENFIERLFAHRRLKDLFGVRWTLARLIEFHAAHKMSLLSHSTTACQELGSIVANGKATRPGTLRRSYETVFMQTLAIPATRRRHANVLNHMAGHLKKVVDSPSRQELADTIDEYRRELIPLVVPLTLIRHHVRVHGIEYLADQVYLDPHPRELMLRNHV